MTYLKCRWDEPRADPYVKWGCSWWFLEFGPDGAITRQVEVYDSGVRVRYGLDHFCDEFGQLGEGRLREMDLPVAEVLTAEQFEAVWESVKSNGTIH